MSQVVEVSLRLPVRPKIKSALFPYGIGDIRFTKKTEVEKVPQVGESLMMSAESQRFPCKVIQRHWDERKNMFVLACEYGGSSRISDDEYVRILESSEWTPNALL